MADKLSYCQACLSNERKLYPLVHLQDLLRQLHLCEMNSDGGVCWECRSVILKFDRFKGQVGYAQQLLRHSHKLQDLKCLSNLSINVNSNNYEFNFNDPLINSDSEPNIVIKQEIETENICSDITEYFKEIDEKDDLFYDIDCEEKPVIDSDIYVDILNSSLKKERKLSKKFRTKVKPKKYKTKSKLKTDIDEEEVKQKFTMVVFTEEEMIRNREEKRNQPNFKKIPFKCDSCVLGFTRKDTYNLHMEKKHDENIGAHQCTVCHIRFPAAKQVERHSRKHYVCYRCRLCKYETGELWSAVSHCRLKHDGDTWQRIHCQECGAVAKTPEEMSHHMGTEHSIICNECGEKFKGHNTLRLHKRAAENMSDEESESSRCYNKKLQEQPFAQQESRGSDTSVRESDVDASQKRSKRKRNVNGDESGLYEESHEDSYLELLVKKDQASFTALSSVKHKEKKHKCDSGGNLASTNKESESSSTMKSVKRKIDNIDESINESETKTFLDHLANEPIDYNCRVSDSNETMAIEDKFSSGESVGDTHKASKHIVLSKSNKTNNDYSDHTEIITSDDEYTAEKIVVKPQQTSLEIKNLTKLNIIADEVKPKDNKSFKLEATVTYSSKKFTSEDETGENNTFETGDATDNKENEITASPISSRPPGAFLVSRRILFDDDMEMDSDIADSSDNSAVSLKLRQIIKDRQNFSPLPCKFSENISVDECPSDLDIHSLKDSDIFLDKDSKCKIKVDDQTYKGIDESKDKISLPTSEHSEFVIKSVPIVDTVQFHEKIHNMDDNITKNNQTNLIPEKIHRHVGHDDMKTMKTPVCNEKKKKKKNCAPWSSRSRCPSRCGLHHVILRKITKMQKKRIRSRGK